MKKENKLAFVIVKGETQTGKKFEHRYYAEELKKKDGDYGNGCYISITKVETNEYFDYIDCRYFKEYEFYKYIASYFMAYFGENLKELIIRKYDSMVELSLMEGVNINE